MACFAAVMACQRQSDSPIIKGLVGFDRKTTKQGLHRLCSCVLLLCCSNSLCDLEKSAHILRSQFPRL